MLTVGRSRNCNTIYDDSRPRKNHVVALSLFSLENITIELRRTLLLPFGDLLTPRRLIASCGALAFPGSRTCARPNRAMRSNRSRLKTTSEAPFMSTTSSCRRCAMSRGAGSCLWPLTAQLAGSTWELKPVDRHTRGGRFRRRCVR